MEPEDDKGNVEYKLALVDPSPKKLDTLITQMGYRIQEGDGKAIYWIGVMDDGRTIGIAEWAFNRTVDLLKDMAVENDANAVVIHKKNVGNDKTILGKALRLPRMKQLFLNEVVEKNICDVDVSGDTEEYKMEVQSVISSTSVSSNTEIGELPDRFIGCVHVSKEPRNIGYNVVTVGTTGNADSGKSTLLGVLTRSVLDNGNGLARSHVLTHKHEIERRGMTSSVSHQIMGYDENGYIIDLSQVHNPTWGDVVDSSQRVIKFHDMAGQAKYFKTTSKGLSRHKPNYAILMVSATNGVQPMTIEHLHYLGVLKIPIIVVISKVDKAPNEVYDKTIDDVDKMLKKVGLIPYVVNDMEDAIRASSVIVQKSENKKATLTKVIPIFRISNVTGQGLDELRRFLFCLPNYIDYDTEGPVKFFVHDIFQKVRGVGLVVSGILESGTVRVGDTKYIGPNSEGKFVPVIIKSIQVNRQDLQYVEAGYECTFAFRQPPERINRQMNILDRELCTCSYTFKAKIRTFKVKSTGISNSITMRIGYQPHLTINNIARSAKFVFIDTLEKTSKKRKAPLVDRKTKKELNRKRVVRPGDEAIVYLQFDRPYRIESGDIFIFREQLTYGSGTIIEPVDEYPRVNNDGNIIKDRPVQINKIKNFLTGKP